VLKPWEFDNPPCAEVGTDIFFTPDKDRPIHESRYEGYKMARIICRECPFVQACAEWGIKNEVHGMWGGLTPQERQMIRRKRGMVVEPRVSYVP
jgi:hypothetical protein